MRALRYCRVLSFQASRKTSSLVWRHFRSNFLEACFRAQGAEGVWKGIKESLGCLRIYSTTFDAPWLGSEQIICCDCKRNKLWVDSPGLWGKTLRSTTFIPWHKTRSRVWLWQWVSTETCWTKPTESMMAPKAFWSGFVDFSMWILKSPKIRILSAMTTKSDRNSGNSMRNAVYGPGGL